MLGLFETHLILFMTLPDFLKTLSNSSRLDQDSSRPDHDFARFLSCLKNFLTSCSKFSNTCFRLCKILLDLMKATILRAHLRLLRFFHTCSQVPETRAGVKMERDSRDKPSFHWPCKIKIFHKNSRKNWITFTRFALIYKWFLLFEELFSKVA